MRSGHPEMGKHDGVRVLLDKRGRQTGVGAGLPVLAERGGRVPALVGERDVLPVLLDEFDASTMFTCFWTS
jgi:hypothetical protein